MIARGRSGPTRTRRVPARRAAALEASLDARPGVCALVLRSPKDAAASMRPLRSAHAALLTAAGVGVVMLPGGGRCGRQRALGPRHAALPLAGSARWVGCGGERGRRIERAAAAGNGSGRGGRG